MKKMRWQQNRWLLIGFYNLWSQEIIASSARMGELVDVWSLNLYCKSRIVFPICLSRLEGDMKYNVPFLWAPVTLDYVSTTVLPVYLKKILILKGNCLFSNLVLLKFNVFSEISCNWWAKFTEVSFYRFAASWDGNSKLSLTL